MQKALERIEGFPVSCKNSEIQQDRNSERHPVSAGARDREEWREIRENRRAGLLPKGDGRAARFRAAGI